MGIDPLSAMNRVRELRGMSPINSHAIEGNPLSEEERAEQDIVARMYGPEDGESEGVGSLSGQASPPSPLIPQVAASQVTQVQAPQQVPDPDFVVAITGNRSIAGVKGREVTLGDADRAKVRVIVLKALQREVVEWTKVATTKRGRRAKAAVKGPVVEPVAPELVARKRGRPKGSKNKSKS